MEMAIPKTLPQEIITDILTRLPTKLIGQCRCISKPWRTLLSDPQFIKLHLILHAHKHEQNLIFLSKSHSLHTITFNDNPKNETNAVSRRLTFQQLSDNWEFVGGSCHGLVLVVNKENVNFLINPTTLEYHMIPNCHLALPLGDRFTMYGLGYDSASDDYKVVILSQYEIDNTIIDIYSVRMGVWRRKVESLPYDQAYTKRTCGVLVNGALHFLAYKAPDGLCAIVAFDLSDEKCLELPPPYNTTLDHDFVFYAIVALRGLLCMITYIEENKIDVWMMKNYGLEQSWTKFCVTRSNTIYGLITVCLTRDDDLIFDEIDQEKLIVYSMKEDQWRYIMVDRANINYGSTLTFMESLVSPRFDKVAEGCFIA